jgi:hypothetical protein
MTAPLATLADLRLATRERADRILASGDYADAFITDAELARYINQSLFELYDLLASRYESYYYLGQNTFITDGVSDRYSLPVDFYKLLGVDLQINANSSGANGYLTLRRFEMPDRNKYAYPNTQVTFGVLTDLRYKLAGNTLWLVPRAGAGQVVRLWYVPRLAPLVTSASLVVGTLQNLDTVTFQVGSAASTTLTAVTSASPTTGQFLIGTATASATNLLTAMAAYSNLTPLVGVNLSGTITFTSTTSDPITWSSSNSTSLALTPTDRWSYMADGIGGWLEYVIVDCAIKMLQKEEGDVQVLMMQKQALTKRIEEMAHNRDAGAPSSVRDVQSSNPLFPGWGGPGGYSGY